MVNKEVNITRLDAFSYRQAIKDGEAIVLIPVGALEQHGPHMPLYTDAMLSTKMAELTAENIDALVGPTIWTGYKSQQRSGGGNHIIGSFGFDASHVVETCRTLVREFHRHGVKKIGFINGHYENYQFLYEGVDLAMRDIAHSGETTPTILLLSYWDFVTDETIAELYPDGFPGWDVEHGGVMETSIMLEYYPDLVHMDKVMDLPAAELPPFDAFPVDPSRTPESGCLSSAAGSTAEKGRLLTKSVVDGMSQALREQLSVQ